MRNLAHGSGYSSSSSWFSPQPSDSVAQVSLAAGTQQRIAIPTGAKEVLFSFGGDFWALFGTGTVAAAIGSAGTPGANAELNPTTRRIPDGATHVSVIAAEVQAGSISFYG